MNANLFIIIPFLTESL